MIESAYYIGKNASTLHAFRAELCLLPTRFLEINLEHSQYLSRVTAGAAPTKKGRVYKIATQTHLSANSSSHYSFDFYLPTFHLLGCDLPRTDPVGDLGLLLKPYDCEPMTGSSYSQTQPWSVACVIAGKRPRSTWSLRPLEPPYGWLDARLVGRNEYGSQVFGQPNRCEKSWPSGSAKDSANGGLDCKTDLGSEAWVNECVPPRIRSSEGIRPEE